MIAIGATSGAVVGAWLTNQLVGSGLVRTEYLLLVALVPLGASIALTRSSDRREGGRSDTSNRGRPKQRTEGVIPLVLGTRFLLVVAIITLILNWVNTNGENLLFRIVQDTLTRDLSAKGITNPEEIIHHLRAATTAFYGSFFFWVNVFALCMQALLASRLLKYGGFGAIFLMLPVIALVSYSAMLLVPLLAVVKWMKVAENSTDYSINNTARHVLWLPMSQEITLKAKPTIDSLFVRAGDGLAALTVLLGVRVFTLPLASYALVSIVLVVVWLLGALWVVREHKSLVASQATEPKT
jgi:AAA family ATP:ADP antiporter